jgi:protein phosphatase
VKLRVPELALVVLAGPSGSGKSTFARRHFLPTEVLSSDACRAMVADDENDQSATGDAFEILHRIAGKRLARGLLTVVDATNVQPEARKPLVALAREHYVPAVAIVFALPEDVCAERNRLRTDRRLPPHSLGHQQRQLHRSLSGLEREGFRAVHVLRSPEEVDAASIVRHRLRPDRKLDHGPFDLIGDVHGCGDELEELLGKLGYRPDPAGVWSHPEGRKVVFLGDLVDRGPRVADVLRIAMGMVEARTALCVPGNHDAKLVRWLQGRRVRMAHGLERSVEQLEGKTARFRQSVESFLDGLPSHLVLDGGRLVAAHGGMKEEMQGRAGGRVREFALYGETTGELDEFGLPVRANWAAGYRGQAMVVYGHTPVLEPEWLNRTINIDTGCVFGGKLTALRYPELELVSVPAWETYTGTARPFLTPPVPGLNLQQAHDEALDLAEFTGKRFVETRLRGRVTIREESAEAALEGMSRLAVSSRWLLYLPPLTPPSDASNRPGLLEHPAEAFAEYRREGLDRVVCEEKHPGSRVVVILCRDEDAARRRFGAIGDGIGVCLDRTGRRFFGVPKLENDFLGRLRDGLSDSGFWEGLQTDWVCLEGSMMPRSAGPRDVVREHYAPVAAAARAGLPKALARLAEAGARGVDVTALLARYRERQEAASRYAEAYRRLWRPARTLADLSFAPFHLLATEGAVHADKDHVWHLETLAQACGAAKGLLVSTRYRLVDLADAESEAEAVAFWEEIAGSGGDGAVIKPFAFAAQGPKGLVQPALVCRAPEALRLVYGPEYSFRENLERLRARRLGHQRSLALRELALGIEGLERFVRREPLRRVFECVFGVVAVESEAGEARL